ncbi:SagB/ThcOx family dehydrogenase [candidate division KSB1 bacterium]|nr:SagB/ThcOx family dehydrogenase [candidate division KSB1 bacterium]
MENWKIIGFPVVMLLLSMTITLTAQDLNSIKLPEPRKEGGRPLMQVLQDRKSVRSFKPDTLSLQLLSDLCWAAFGINRESGGRTAPSARNRQEIDLYVALQKGLFLYDALTHQLNPITPQDVRSHTGTQDFVGVAPLNLVYVADLTKMGEGPEESKMPWANADTGFISENVYLFCASEGLATVVRGMVDREQLALLMKLRPDQRIILAQTVGHPQEY